MSIAKRRFFTIIELMIVAAFISIVAGLFTIGIIKSVREQRFRSEVAIVIDHLRLAQNIMLILHVDASVHFKSEPEGQSIHMWIEAADNANLSFLKNILKPKELQAIQYLEMEDLLSNLREPGRLVVKFFSDGLVMSKGIMRLSTAKDDKSLGSITRYINLPGFPSAIVSSSENLLNKPGSPSDASNTLTTLTVYEISQFLQTAS